jgi:hypothetical protein
VRVVDEAAIGEAFLDHALPFLGRQTAEVDIVDERQIDVAAVVDASLLGKLWNAVYGNVE